MSSLYVPFAVEYMDSTGVWRLYQDTDEEDQMPSYMSLPSDPVRLRINLEHETSTEVKKMPLSEYNVQWHVGNSRVIKSPELNYYFPNAGIKSIKVYIARGDGLVISRGSEKRQTGIKIKIKNFIQTNINTTVQGEEDVDWRVVKDEDGVTLASIVFTSVGKPTAPLRVYNQHTWQLYNETPDKFGVHLYADNAGKRRTSYGTTGNDCAPLKTPSYFDNKYAQFQKTWRFCTDADLEEPVDHITIPPEKIYAKRTSDGTYQICDVSETGAEFVGTSGYKDIYYVDDSMIPYLSGSVYEAYRLHFQMDTVGWPDYQSGIQLNTAQMKQSPDYVVTPDHYQGPKAEMHIDVRRADITQLVFTSTGIRNHHISPVKFQGTEIPFVVSMADINGNIVKHSEGLSGQNSMIPTKIVPNIPWTDIDMDSIEKHTYYIGISSPQAMSSSWFNISQNKKLIDNDIRTYSSFVGVLSCTHELKDAVLVAALSTTESGFISGMSSPFSILPNSGKYKFFHKGESIDYGNQVNGYVLQENINQHGRLQAMINSIFGNFYDAPESLGKVIHEKIQNFVSNNSDVDMCNSTSINGLAREVDSTISNFDMSFPGGVRRLVDIFSIGFHHLVGDRHRYDDDFDSIAIVEGDRSVKYGRNLGNQLNIDTYMVSAGNVLIAKELYGDQFFKITPTYIPGDTNDPHYTTYENMNGLSSYPLTDYDRSWNWGLSYPQSSNIFSDYYDFYEYKSNDSYPVSSFDSAHGVIDWAATEELKLYNHVLEEDNQTYDEWFSDTGVVQSSLEYSIRKGLKIL